MRNETFFGSFENTIEQLRNESHDRYSFDVLHRYTEVKENMRDRHGAVEVAEGQFQAIRVLVVGEGGAEEFQRLDGVLAADQRRAERRSPPQQELDHVGLGPFGGAQQRRHALLVARHLRAVFQQLLHHSRVARLRLPTHISSSFHFYLLYSSTSVSWRLL